MTKLPDDQPRPMSAVEARELRAHSRGWHREYASDRCPMCEDPDYWTKKARRLARLATPVNDPGTDPHLEAR